MIPSVPPRLTPNRTRPRPCRGRGGAGPVQLVVGDVCTEFAQAASSCSYSACSSGHSGRPTRAAMNVRMRSLALAVASGTHVGAMSQMIVVRAVCGHYRFWMTFTSYDPDVTFPHHGEAPRTPSAPPRRKERGRRARRKKTGGMRVKIPLRAAWRLVYRSVASPCRRAVESLARELAPSAALRQPAPALTRMAPTPPYHRTQPLVPFGHYANFLSFVAFLAFARWQACAYRPPGRGGHGTNQQVVNLM